MDHLSTEDRGQRTRAPGFVVVLLQRHSASLSLCTAVFDVGPRREIVIVRVRACRSSVPTSRGRPPRCVCPPPRRRASSCPKSSPPPVNGSVNNAGARPPGEMTSDVKTLTARSSGVGGGGYICRERGRCFVLGFFKSAFWRRLRKRLPSELGLNAYLGVCLCCDSICFLFILSPNTPPHTPHTPPHTPHTPHPHPHTPKLQTQILPWAQMLGNLCPGPPSALQSAMLTEIETGVRRHLVPACVCASAGRQGAARESAGGVLVPHPLSLWASYRPPPLEAWVRYCRRPPGGSRGAFAFT